ncbi:MAG: hypothetical protein ACR2Q3_01645 [Woeseiaceae bacterium]
MQIVEYKIIHGYTILEVEHLVNGMLASNRWWQPVGPIGHDPTSSSDANYFQTMWRVQWASADPDQPTNLKR